MSIDKKGFRYRLSNVIAWFGLGCLVLEGFVALGPDGFSGTGAFCWAFMGVINYLMMGSLRLLPWKDIE